MIWPVAKFRLHTTLFLVQFRFSTFIVNDGIDLFYPTSPHGEHGNQYKQWEQRCPI